MLLQLSPSRRASSRGCALGICFVLTACLGCGGTGDAREYDVSGTVSHGGQPVPTGAIVFEPDVSKGNSGPSGFAPIKDGRFDTRDGQGVMGGPYVIKISGNDGKQDELGLLPAGQPLFQEHEMHVELPKEDSEQTFDVPRQ